jgi:hypothetical protein
MAEELEKPSTIVEAAVALSGAGVMGDPGLA